MPRTAPSDVTGMPVASAQARTGPSSPNATSAGSTPNARVSRSSRRPSWIVFVSGSIRLT